MFGLKKDISYNFTFACVKCGECCKEPGYVLFTKEDIKNAAKYLGIKKQDFVNKYLKKAYGAFVVEVLEDEPCLFLKKDKCSINDVKPEQCQTFPYWEEHVDENGNLINFNRKCPGTKT